jgi:hypothetical protein
MKKGDAQRRQKRGPIYSEGRCGAKIKSEGACSGWGVGAGSGGSAWPHHTPPAQRPRQGRHGTGRQKRRQQGGGGRARD